MPIGRQFWVIVHRWAGLTLALFLIVSGATGALMPFYEELNGLAAPWRVVTAPTPKAHVLNPLILRERALSALPGGSKIDFIGLDVSPDRTFDIFPEFPADAKTSYDYIALNPYDGAVVHRGTRADLSDGLSELLPFVLALHFSLALGAWGIWAFGIAAVVWTIDCFVGFYLTLPHSRGAWWQRWHKAWMLRLPPPSWYRMNVDLHRASGLWLWPILFVFAWSSVAMNLRPVYDPVMSAIGLGEPAPTIPIRPTKKALHDWPRAVEMGRRVATERGRQMGFAIVRDGYIYFDETTGLYSYNFKSSRDIPDATWSMVSFDSTGRVGATVLADGRIKDGGATIWLLALHTANVGGLPYRIFVALLGIGVVLLSVTGIVIWMRKRSARLINQRRASFVVRTEKTSEKRMSIYPRVTRLFRKGAALHRGGGAP